MGGQTRPFTYCKLHEVQRRIWEVTHYPTINSVELLVRTRSIFPWLVRVVSNRSVRYNGRHPRLHLPWVPEAFHARFPVSVKSFKTWKKWPERKASGPERHPFDSAEPITTPPIPKHPASGCFADCFLGGVECFKCSDWITVAIGAWSGRWWFEGDKDQTQTI